jgi:hypothetical protein
MVDDFTDCKRFQTLASELISPRIQINAEEEVDKAACDFIACIASAYRQSTSKIILSGLNKKRHGLESLLKYKRKLKNLWKVTRDPACKTALNWVAKNIGRLTHGKALERWKTNVTNCEVTFETSWPITKSLMERVGPQAPTAVHGPSGITYHPNEKEKVIVGCLENS